MYSETGSCLNLVASLAKLLTLMDGGCVDDVWWQVVPVVKDSNGKVVTSDQSLAIISTTYS